MSAESTQGIRAFTIFPNKLLSRNRGEASPIGGEKRTKTPAEAQAKVRIAHAGMPAASRRPRNERNVTSARHGRITDLRLPTQNCGRL